MEFRAPQIRQRQHLAIFLSMMYTEVGLANDALERLGQGKGRSHLKTHCDLMSHPIAAQFLTWSVLPRPGHSSQDTFDLQRPNLKVYSAKRYKGSRQRSGSARGESGTLGIKALCTPNTYCNRVPKYKEILMFVFKQCYDSSKYNSTHFSGRKPEVQRLDCQ